MSTGLAGDISTFMVGNHWRLLFVLTLSPAALSCRTEQLATGANVATSPSPPIDAGFQTGECRSLGFVVGRGGGAFGGGWITNEKLIEYAMNDLRNKAAGLGANFVQHDTPTMGVAGSEGSTTTTATVSGTAYACTRGAYQASSAPAAVAPLPSAPVSASTPGSAQAAAPSASAVAGNPPARVCIPGTTQACVGPGACKGGQFCLEDGSRFGPCDCGSEP